MKDVVIVGHGGLGRECAFLISEINRVSPTWNLLGYVGQNAEAVGQRIGGFDVLWDDLWLDCIDRHLNVVLAVGHPPALRFLQERFARNRHLAFPVIAHPSVTADWSQVQIGRGTILFNGVALTTDIEIGEFNIINPGCTISHDCVLGGFNLLGPGVHLAGAVRMGSEILLGTGVQVLPGIQISDGVAIGAGAVVCHSITDRGTYVGIPARRLQGGQKA